MATSLQAKVFENWSIDHDMCDMWGKHVIVTGANSGIGFQIARNLAKHHATVTMAVRNLDKGHRAKDDILRKHPHAKLHVELLDLASFDSIHQFATRYADTGRPLHVLINNAGEFCPPPGYNTDDGLERTIGVNYYGAAYLTMQLLPLLQDCAPSRVLFQGSLTHTYGYIDWHKIIDKGGLGYGGTMAYGTSKLLSMMWARELADHVDGTGVDVNVVHPGYSHTCIARKADESAYWGAAVFDVLVTTLGQSPTTACIPALYAATEPKLQGKNGLIIGPNVLNTYNATRRYAYNILYYNSSYRARLLDWRPRCT
jgi:NAD(P)-dependent dehydrogenase (short-subunit alcohol dehydrogenase family)